MNAKTALGVAAALVGCVVLGASASRPDAPSLVWATFAADVLIALVYGIAVPYVAWEILARYGVWNEVQAPKTDVVLWTAFIVCCGLEHAVTALDVVVPAPHLVLASKSSTAVLSLVGVISTWRNRKTYRIMWRAFKGAGP